MKTGPALRWFWRIYIPLAVLLVIGMLAVPLGQFVEESVWPVRTDQRIEGIVRAADRLCWTWVSVKARDRVSDNMDVFLSTISDRMVLSIFERDTGLPWGKSRAVSLGPHRQNYWPPAAAQRDGLRTASRRSGRLLSRALRPVAHRRPLPHHRRSARRHRPRDASVPRTEF